MEENILSASLWQQCTQRLSEKLSDKEFGTWIMPLQAIDTEHGLDLLAPNALVKDQIEQHYLSIISRVVSECAPNPDTRLRLKIGSNSPVPDYSAPAEESPQPTALSLGTRLDPKYTFESFVQGKSNHIARAAAEQVADNPGGSYNPLLIYGGSGLGKTHLMHGVGHRMVQSNPRAKVVYRQAERFVNEMVAAIRHNKMDEFKSFYRSCDALLIDDIQFFAGKKSSQEEFFHTFNALLEGKQQIVLTCDRFPKELDDLEERLKGRFSWGLSVSVEPPELETRVAILMSKAEQASVNLPQEVAFFVAKRVRSNVRDLESALHRLIAGSQFTGIPIHLDFAKQVLQDMLAVHDRLVTLDNIIKTVAEYYKIRVSDMSSSRRSRSIARPRQIAMALAKELTNHSLPEIGEAFGGRDHTTVLHACRKVEELRESDSRINEDYGNLSRILSH